MVFRSEELFVRVYLDEPFISFALEKCKEFIKVGVLPELLAKFYSREPMSPTLSTSTTSDRTDLEKKEVK